MTTITITLDDERALLLRERAKNLGVAPEELARRGVENILEEEAFAPNFEQAVSVVLEENAELYRRLA